MGTVHIAHDCRLGDNIVIANGCGISGHCEIDDYAVIGGMTGMHQFVRVGAHAMVAGGSMVRKDVPPYVLAGKEPLSYIGINSTGLRRRGFSSDTIHTIQDIYRIIYQGDMNITQAINHIEAEFEPGAERDAIIEFVRSSSRGLMRGFHD